MHADQSEGRPNVFARINDGYYSFTSSERKVADYIMRLRARAQFLSITELAEKSNVAEATVTRFCRHLGFKGYSAFRLALAQSSDTSGADMNENPLSGEVLESDSFEDMCRKLQSADAGAISQTLDVIDRKTIEEAANLIEHAGKVLCMGQGGSMLLAQEAAHLFTTAGGKFFAVGDSHMQSIAAATMAPEDVILFFSYSGATNDMMQIFELAAERGVRIILVTRYPNSPGAAMADVVLLCGSNENPLQLGSVAARIAQMYLLDVLFSELCRRHLDRCRETRARISEALKPKHLK